MKVSDNRSISVLDERSLVRQTPGPQENWQDSVVLTWWDAANNIGGMHRIGHEPNLAGGGRIALWNTLFSPQGIYKKTAHLPLRDADRLPSGGFGGGDGCCRSEYVDGAHIWTVDDGDVYARIVHHDISGNVDCYPKGGRLTDEFAAAHLDIPGRVEGVLRINGYEYRINGLSVRDHGWGPRDWASVLSHRWIAGTCGSELSFIAVAWHTTDDAMATFGWVVRGDTITFAHELDILTYTEIDAATNRGGRLRYTLTTGETLTIECEPVSQAAVSFHEGVCCVDRLCRATCGDLVGFCDFETTANIQQGKRRPTKMVNAIIDSGFFAAEAALSRSA